jgi:MYXO-CTERM domain-containing protein
LIRQTAQTAATLGGYTPPDWAGAPAADGGTTNPGGEGNPCKTNDECDSKTCATQDGTTSYCVATCDPSNPSCDSGYTCGADTNGNNECFPNAGGAGGSGNGATTTTRTTSCSVSPMHGPTSPVPWKTAAVLVGLAVVSLRRRRR